MFDRSEIREGMTVRTIDGHKLGHVMAVRGKTIVAAMYGAAPSYSYFNGCSTGGRQALTAAQRAWLRAEIDRTALKLYLA